MNDLRRWMQVVTETHDIDAYHGSDSPSIEEFDDAKLHGWQYGARGHSFALKPNVARGYGKYLYHVKLRVQNPKVVQNTEDFASLRADFLRAEGYDAAIGPNDLGQWEIRVLDPKNVRVVGRTVQEASGTVGAALTVPDLIRRYGGRVVEFRNLPATAKQAIRKRAAEHLDPDAKTRINPKMRFGYVELPTEALKQAVLAAVQREGAPFKTFDEYHRWYISHGDTPSHTEVWPIELDTDDPDQVIEDGSHRFHSYVRSGVKMIPAIYRI